MEPFERLELEVLVKVHHFLKYVNRIKDIDAVCTCSTHWTPPALTRSPADGFKLTKFHSRTLMEADDYDNDDGILLTTTGDGSVDAESALNGTANVDCGEKYVNQTESILLNDVLSSWVDRHEKQKTGRVMTAENSRDYYHYYAAASDGGGKKTQQNQKPNNNSSKHASAPSTAVKRNASKSVSDDRQLSRKTASTRKVATPDKPDSWTHLDLLSRDDANGLKQLRKGRRLVNISNDRRKDNNHHHEFDVDLYDSVQRRQTAQELKYLQLMIKALQQRDDTLYLISMKDYILLPPTARNSTVRPRMSLIVPALSANGSSPNQIALMRIECEVIGTSLFQMPDTFMPTFFNQTVT